MTRGTALVLGGTGFVGQVVVQYLASAGYDVWTTTRHRGQVGENDKTISFDARSGQASVNVLRTCAASLIVNAAAYGVAPTDRDPALMRAVNIDLPERLADFAADTGARLIHLGSCSEYLAANSAEPLTENAPLEMSKPYGATKAKGGELMAAIARARRSPAARLRLFNVYGPGEKAHRLLPSLLRSLGDGQRVSLSLGTQVRDWVYVGDVAQAIIAVDRALAAGRIESGEVFNVATGIGLSVAEFATTVARLSNAPEDLLGFGDLPFRPDDVAHLVGNSDRLARVTSYRPKTTLHEGLSLSLNGN